MSGRRWVANSARWLILLLLLVAPFVAPSAAHAHALLQQSTPADGVSYDRSPGDVQLVFTENVEVAATSVQLFDGAGRPVGVGTPVSDDGAAKATVLSIPLSQLPKDRYLLRWRTISSDDLHPTAGTIVFGIGTGVTPATQDDSSGWTLAGSILEAVLRWLALMALGFSLAALVLSRGLARSPDGQLAALLPKATRVTAGVGAGAALALGVLYLGRIVEIGGLDPIVTAWDFTLRWIVAVVSAGMAWLLLRRAGRRGRASDSMASVVLLVLSMTAITSTSHPTSAGIAIAVLGAVHTVATMLWSCGAAVVAVVAVPALRRCDRGRAVGVARAFTPIALIALPLSLVTGLLLAGRLLPSVGALLNTDYGHALLIKLGLLAVGLLCAAGTVAFLVMDAGRRRSAMIVAAEAVVLCAVVLAASSLAATHPASPVVWAPASEQTPTAGVLSQFADDLVVTVDVGPGRPGRNFVTVGVLDTRRPAPAPVAEVSLAIGAQPALVAVPQGQVQWMAVANVKDEGPVTLEVTVKRPGEPSVRVPFVWTLGPAVGTRLGGAPLAPITSAAALLIGVFGLLALVACALLRARRRRSPTGPVEQDEVQMPFTLHRR
jgi:copper transport protein